MELRDVCTGACRTAWNKAEFWLNSSTCAAEGQGFTEQNSFRFPGVVHSFSDELALAVSVTHSETLVVERIKSLITYI